MPSGNDAAAAKAIFDALYAYALREIPQPRVTILWEGPIYLYGFAAIMIGSFFAYSWWAQHHTRKRGELYGPISFGALTERIGAISTFDWLMWGVLTLWSLWIIIDHVLNGQYYMQY